ncbi:MAG: PD-(D/E)XK nuclease family protein [Prevotellaceae bacterium]|jgi:CRISPR/Cas system-associated exonuclease Cas4 (RecB family)|nr:PD-(D/E)XK nuclease family protein [Prevotellaceae bacterium]
MDFLAAVTANLYARYREKISDLCLVFPNKRAHLFFSRNLARSIDQPLWQPTYKSIEELIGEASPWRVADNYTLLAELYTIYCAERQTGEPFDHFYHWGQALLQDFDEIDKYLVDAASLFTNLRESKALEGDFSFLTPEQIAYIRQFWSHFSDTGATTLQHDFETLWETLYRIYHRFRATLTAGKMAYEGMIYRYVAEAIIAGEANDWFPKHYVFIGFNALSKCEKTLFHFLQTRQKADFYWDYDAYYLNNKQQEAGLFLRENVKDFPSPLFDPLFSPFSEAKKITIIAAPSNIAQAKAIPQLLDELATPPDERTALVLADKQLLIPVLHALPAVKQEINISMGYPLRQTGVYSLIDLLLSLFGSQSANIPPATVTGKSQKDATPDYRNYYYKDILALLAHSYIKQLADNNANEISNKLVNYNNIYVSNQFFSDYQLLYDLLKPLTDYREIVDRLLFLMDNLSRNAALHKAEPFLHGYIQHVVRVLNKLTGALQKSGLDISVNLYIKLLRTVLQLENIPFTGEPLAGIQVLGLFETIAIDFDNVIILSANEGILPHTTQAVSFIPYNLRRGFGLPTQEQQEAILAYYFYRLLQRAKQVTLLHSTKNDGIRTGEASRYLWQLKLESGHPVTEKTLVFNIEIPENEPIVIEKMDAMLRPFCEDRRSDEAEKQKRGLSPSAINTYLACSLRFYFRYIARIKEPNEVSEQIDARQFGTLLHKSMELLYKPLLGHEVTDVQLNYRYHDLAFIQKTVQQAIAVEFYKSDSLPPDFWENGDLMMVYDIICQYVRQLLAIDKKQAPFTPEKLEWETGQVFSFTANGQSYHIRIDGIIDRVHKKGDNWYIVDYKTGRPDSEFESITDLFGDNPARRHDGILQILLYSLILQNDKKQRVTPLIYFLRDSHSDRADVAIYDKSAKDKVVDISIYAEELQALLLSKLNELFDLSVPFSQTKDTDTCKYCPYVAVCGKQAN